MTANSIPAADARIVALGPVPEYDTGPSTRTDRNGRYVIPAVESNRWGYQLLSASKSGYFTDLRYLVYANPPTDTQLDLQLDSWRLIPLNQVVHGRIGEARCAGLGYGGFSGGALCQRFAVTAPVAGTLDVTASAAAFNFDVTIVRPDGTIAAENGSSSVSVHMTIPVEAGATYQIQVAGGWSPASAFDLIALVR